MSKGRTNTQPIAVQAPVNKADDAVLALARLLGRQAAREMAALETTPDTITQANEAIRQLIEKIRLVPEGNTLIIELFGELAALISLGTGPNDKHPLADAKGVQVTLVAGVGFAQDPTITTQI